MSDRPSLSISDLSPTIRKQLRLKRPRRRGMSADQVRTHALRALSVLADLSKNDRARVLRHALKVNSV